MPDVTPLARTPIPVAEPAGIVDGWQISARRSRADLRLADHTACVKVVVRADPDGTAAERFGVGVGRAIRTDQGLMCRFSPGEWLALATLDRRVSLPARLQALAGGAGDLVSVIDLTHGRALLRLTGERAAAALSRICAIDLHDDVTPDGTALRTSVAALVTDIVRDDARGQPSYLLGCEWSSGQYLWDAVMQAGQEFGIDADGFDGSQGI